MRHKLTSKDCLEMSNTADEKFTARFDEKLVDPPTEKYDKPVVVEKVLVIEKVVQQTPLTVTVEVSKKKKKTMCSIQ